MTNQAPVPRWARALDVLCVLLACAAVIFTVSGGFRVRVFGVRLGVTSPLRLFLWAVAVGVLRHVLARQQPLYRHLPRQVAAWSRMAAVRTAAGAVVGTRPAILFVGYLAVFMVGYAGGQPPLRHFNNELMNLPVRWDAGWYLQIVTDGYHFSPEEPMLQQNIVFLPAYPALVKASGRLLGGHMTGYVLGGMLISVGAFFGALIYLYAFARDALGEETARGAVWLLAAYPFAVFFGALYTESLFLLGTIGAFHHFSRGQFGRAALWGLLVGLTRLNGALLMIPLLVLAASSARRDGWSARRLGAAIAPAAGFAIYALWMWRFTGDPLTFVAAHVAWGRTYQGLGALVAQQYSVLAHGGLSAYVGTPGYDVLNAAGALFVLAAVWPVARLLGVAYALFILVNILPGLAAGGLLSAGRFSAVLFPAFVWLAAVVPPAHRSGWIASFAAGQAFNAVLFYSWRPLF
jgi:hypothetical protein